MSLGAARHRAAAPVGRLRQADVDARRGRAQRGAVHRRRGQGRLLLRVLVQRPRPATRSARWSRSRCRCRRGSTSCSTTASQYWPSHEYRRPVRRRQRQHRRGLQRRDLPARVPPRRRSTRCATRSGAAGRGSSTSRSATGPAATSRSRPAIGAAVRAPPGAVRSACRSTRRACSTGCSRVGRGRRSKIAHGLFEVFNAGYLPAAQWQRSPTGQVMMGGA